MLQNLSSCTPSLRSKSDIPAEVRPIVPTPPAFSSPSQSTRPPSRPTAPSARRVYLALRGAVLHRCRGDQDCHVARLPPRYASNQSHSCPLICLEADPRSALLRRRLEGVLESRASSDGPDAFSTLSIPASLERSIRPRAIRPMTWTSPQTRSTVSGTPSRSTPRRREPKTDPRHSLHAMLAFLAPHVASSPSRTPWLFSSVLLSPPDAWACRTPWHHLHHLLRAHAQHLRHRPRRGTSPPAATMSNASLSSAQTQLLSGTGSTMRSIAGTRSKCHQRSRRPCRLHRLPAPGAGFLCAHAGLRFKPPPAAQREHDEHHPPRCAAHAAAVPPSPHTLPASHVHPPCHTAPLVDDSAAPPPMRCTPRASFPSPAPATSAAGWQRTDHTETMCTPRFHRYPHSMLGISDKRGWGTATSLGATNRGGDNGTYAAPGFHIAPWPVQFESPARAASTGRELEQASDYRS
ncbi:hypothetical protein B0H14DRAFT_3862874 [Mycena olivaceomarginata]|nr:hypothetical protein B0H14DRAFT_3862874 [Mycena olivaceomarginata]